jgi:predicted nucleic acid-binding protein
MPTVSDTSPILGLASIDCLELLHEQFGAVFIPSAVFEELKTETNFKGTPAIRLALTNGWLEVQSVINIPLVQALSLELDRGESEALALAADLGLEIIVMDEHDGRARAKAMGLKPVGVIGILLRAKKGGKIDSVADALKSLRSEIGFFIAADLYQQILEQAGEQE